MQKITKDMIIGDILRMDPEMAGSRRHALYWMPIRTDGDHRRGSSCSWYRAGSAGSKSKCIC